MDEGEDDGDLMEVDIPQPVDVDDPMNAGDQVDEAADGGALPRADEAADSAMPLSQPMSDGSGSEMFSQAGNLTLEELDAAMAGVDV